MCVHPVNRVKHASNTLAAARAVPPNNVRIVPQNLVTQTPISPLPHRVLAAMSILDQESWWTSVACAGATTPPAGWSLACSDTVYPRSAITR